MSDDGLDKIIEENRSAEHRDDICGEEKADGEPCDNPPKYDDGKCGFHSEHSEFDPQEMGAKGGAAKGEARRFTHGVNAEDSIYYKNIDESERAYIDAMFKAFMKDAPFDARSTGKAELVWQCTIDLHKRRRATDYIAKEGMTQENPVPSGEGVLHETVENPLHMTHDRLGRTAIRILKELGILDDPDSATAENQQNFLELLADQSDDD